MKLFEKIKAAGDSIKGLQTWQKKKLLFWFLLFAIGGTAYLTITCTKLYQDKAAETSYWENGLKENEENAKAAEKYSENATKVIAGTYIENIKEVNVKSSYYRAVIKCWFRWEGDDELDMINHFRIYNGTINKMEVTDDIKEGNTHYQSALVDVTVSKNYWAIRFPLESYQLRLYLESLYSVDRVNLEVDKENSSINPYLTVTGYELMNHDVSLYTMKYENQEGDPEASNPYSQELVTHVEINRVSIGLYIKCFIALFGTLTWVFITLYICTNHRVDPLGMIPGALFGTVTNIMVGANLLPDALTLGLLEYVNLGGIMIILAVAVSVITMNRVRNKFEAIDFAWLFGRVMFYTLLVLTFAGAIAYPLCAYRF